MSRTPRILAIDDDVTWLSLIPAVLEGLGEVHIATTIDEGLNAIETSFFDVVLLDLNFEGDDRTGLEIFRRIRRLDREADVVVISGETDHLRLIEVFNSGITRFIPKMSTADEVREAVVDTLYSRALRQAAHSALLDKLGIPLLGVSSAMTKLRSEINRVVQSQSKDILIIGETGTGKELVAQAIARQADPSGRFVVIHCGAISEGLAESEFFGHVKGAFTGADRDKIGAFEAAGGGFVFLDEIGELPLSQQAKLLRVLQERKIQPVGTFEERQVNFRCVAATHVDLDKAVKDKTFREDLFYRLGREIVQIPALRDRPDDIPILIEYFLGEISGGAHISLTAKAISLLQRYRWPGNVRQLRAVVESLASRCNGSVIRESEVLTAIPDAQGKFVPSVAKQIVGKYGTNLVALEKERFERAIVAAQGNRDEAAKILGVSRATFFRRAKELGLVSNRGTPTGLETPPLYRGKRGVSKSHENIFHVETL